MSYFWEPLIAYRLVNDQTKHFLEMKNVTDIKDET